MYTYKLEKNKTLTKQIIEGLKNTRKHKLIIVIIIISTRFWEWILLMIEERTTQPKI